jgi:hypothetical protein
VATITLKWHTGWLAGRIDAAPLLVDQLAHVVYTMTVFREHCLSLPHGSHIAITNVQQIVEEDVELTRIQ